mmetsp:Transcript_12050/g.34094  ORF Transcript_12050/g.34094 Transcript_12050/m.34094 type:complete len:238 (-) Transcript_12050:368-1081(-)
MRWHGNVPRDEAAPVVAAAARHHSRGPLLGLRQSWPWRRIVPLIDSVEVVEQSGALCCADLAHEEVVLPISHDLILVAPRQCVWTVVSLAVAPLDVPALWAHLLLKLRDVEDKGLPEDLVRAHVHADELAVGQELRAQRVLHELASDHHPFRPMGKAETMPVKVCQWELHTVNCSYITLGPTRSHGIILSPPVPVVLLHDESVVGGLGAAGQDLDEVGLALRGEGPADPVQAVNGVV